MGITKKEFGVDKFSGKTVYEYTLENKKGMKASFINFGAILTQLWVPDAEGKLADVVLGHDSLDYYYENPGFLGAAIGPSANRIGGASFEIDGVKYDVPVNENKNNLHSDKQKGYHVRYFEAVESEDSISFKLQDEDGNMGFPGNKTIEIRYTLTEDNGLVMAYYGASDKKTILNLTNHSYFNLCGQDSERSIEEHVLQINASNYTPADAESIPTGEIAPVKGTPMDFTSPKRIGDEIEADFQAIHFGGGYDHNFVLDGKEGQLQLAAVVSDPATTRVMKVFTTLPGIQFYAGNFLGDQDGKNGAKYHKRYGLALETQFFPDSIHKENFCDAVFGPDRRYSSTTIYQF